MYILNEWAVYLEWIHLGKQCTDTENFSPKIHKNFVIIASEEGNWKSIEK